ncbi:MAG: YceI family protein [Planctomycetes bacterium]|nr:YceI family protein [Planctomycetota bacterium]
MHATRILVSAGLAASLVLGVAFIRPATVDSHNKEAAAQAATWTVDPVHSSITFRIKHAGASWSVGRFNSFSGTVRHDAAAPEKSSVEFTVATDSVDTAMPDRDKHLKSADFFDATQFPKATFTSKSVAKKGNLLAVTGDFALHGVTKSVTVEMELVGTGKGPQGDERAGFSGKLVIQRSDFGIKTYPGMLGEDVTLFIDVETVKK